MADDSERRLNSLFDALNCGTVQPEVVKQVQDITAGKSFLSSACRETSFLANGVCPPIDDVAIQARDPNRALKLHLDLLTSGAADLQFMPALKIIAARSADL
jgi:hypothetical protein